MASAAIVAVRAESMPPDRPQDDRAEVVLLHVVAHAEHERAVDLGGVVEPLGDRRRAAGSKATGSSDRISALDGDRGAVARVVHDLAEARPSPSGRSRSAKQELLGELARAGDQGAVGGDHEGVAVEDQFVLAADLVGVGERAARLRGPPHAQVAPHVVLLPLVRRGVRHHQQTRAGRSGDRHRAALLPQVLADRDGHVDAVQAEDRQPVTAHEVAVFVEDAVVGQVVLGRAGHHPALVEHRGGVEQRAPLGWPTRATRSARST